MAGRITFERLQVKCRFTIQTILKCCIHAKYGEHTRAEVVAVVKGEEVKAVFTDITKEKIEIFSRNDSGTNASAEEILFAGIIEDVELLEEGKYATLSLRAVSYQWKMDVKRKSRSFQNISMTYREVVKAVLQDYGAELIWNCSDRQLEYPLIQYKETDYHFIKRILSHIGEGITTVDSSAKVCIHAGMRKGNSKGEINLKQYSYSMVPFRSKHSDKQQTGYKMEEVDFVRVGDVVQVQGRSFYVMEVSTVFTQNMMKCDCMIFPKQCFKVEKIPAETLRSTVLTGRILETRQELVKMHLDIDKEQSASEAYEFPWKPITGNMLYCMPEVGTKAALYISRTEENTAAVIYNIRENGDECAELADYNNRYFTTDNQKRMYLKPSEMGLLNMKNQNAEIALKDGNVLDVKTGNQLSIMAEGQVELKGKNVTITTPKEATLVKKDIISPTVINMCNAFDAIGKTGNFAAAPQVVEKKRKKAIPGSGQIIEKYSLEGAVETILANIPADDYGSPLMERIAGSMPVVSSMNLYREGKRYE